MVPSKLGILLNIAKPTKKPIEVGEIKIINHPTTSDKNSKIFITLHSVFFNLIATNGKLNDEADFVNKIIKLPVAKTNKK